MIPWDDGRKVTIDNTQTLHCGALQNENIYAVFLYNESKSDMPVKVRINIGGNYDRKYITLPGSNDNQGLAGIAIVRGADTATVSVSLDSDSDKAYVTAWLGSVEMPLNTTGINNDKLPANGKPHPYGTCTRYYKAPKMGTFVYKVRSEQVQFISTVITNSCVTVLINNPIQDPEVNIVATGDAKKDIDYSIFYKRHRPQEIQKEIQTTGGKQYIWMNADNSDSSQHASISLQQI